MGREPESDVKAPYRSAGMLPFLHAPFHHRKKEGGCLVMKRYVYRHFKDDNPSAAAHGGSDGAVHTYAFVEVFARWIN